MSFLSDLLFGRKGKVEQVNTLGGNQKQLLDQLIQQIMSGSGGFGADQDFFNQSFVDPALNTFNTRTAPAIQQRFIGQGQGESGALNDALARAGTDVQSDLNQQLASLVNAALDRQLSGSQLALGTQQFQNVERPGTTGLFQAAGTGIASGLTGGASDLVGGLIRRGFR